LTASTDTQLPASFFHLTGLHTLVLADASPLESPDLVNLTSLTTLHVASSKLTSQRLLITCCSQLERFLDDFGELLPSLRTLSIYECNYLTRLPESLASLSLLEMLKSSTCSRFENLPNNLGHLPALRTLILDELNISNLSDSLCHLRSLKTFFFIHCTVIQQLPEAFSKLTSLETICILNSMELVLPEGIGELCNLQTLDVHENLVQPLPPSFTRLTSLTRLELDGCRPEALLLGIGSLSNLQELLIHHSPIRTLPESITASTSLEILTVDSCWQLSSIPRRLDGFQLLKWLKLTRCKSIGQYARGRIGDPFYVYWYSTAHGIA
ncbi:hypothetical protein CLOM_g881, partial [Closterium sp. NIES-68]